MQGADASMLPRKEDVVTQGSRKEARQRARKESKAGRLLSRRSLQCRLVEASEMASGTGEEVSSEVTDVSIDVARWQGGARQW